MKSKKQAEELARNLRRVAELLEKYEPTRESRNVISVFRGALDVGLEVRDSTAKVSEVIGLFDDQCAGFDFANVAVVRAGGSTVEFVNVERDELKTGDLVLLLRS